MPIKFFLEINTRHLNNIRMIIMPIEEVNQLICSLLISFLLLNWFWLPSFLLLNWLSLYWWSVTHLYFRCHRFWEREREKLFVFTLNSSPSDQAWLIWWQIKRDREEGREGERSPPLSFFYHFFCIVFPLSSSFIVYLSPSHSFFFPTNILLANSRPRVTQSHPHSAFRGVWYDTRGA